MNWYPTIKDYYEEGRYSANDLKVFLQAKWMTPEQYTQITGQEPPTAFNKSISFLKRAFFQNKNMS
ncbi:XkdX family protein [Paenibacillus sp. J2TS4]|uniref:XkdX family protein n=1 Tax=Paenibacillus sp. J2TS4 TaxID=2807194 RepID=UPI001B0B8ACD|nr:XkdX family protein [Paenibacillus sp. J2TS4]GIP35521.1 hypothetical protein J2TS4_47310 [Paenibacillus sp. J2TS4]